MNIQELIKTELINNSNKLSKQFIDEIVSRSEVLYLQPTLNMRICIITVPSGHEVLGVAQVLDVNNDVESLGNSVALQNATNELWRTLGSIAKCYV